METNQEMTPEQYQEILEITNRYTGFPICESESDSIDRQSLIWVVEGKSHLKDLYRYVRIGNCGHPYDCCGCHTSTTIYTQEIFENLLIIKMTMCFNY